jgi:hypothetical protein
LGGPDIDVCKERDHRRFQTLMDEERKAVGQPLLGEPLLERGQVLRRRLETNADNAHRQPEPAGRQDRAFDTPTGSLDMKNALSLHNTIVESPLPGVKV